MQISSIQAPYKLVRKDFQPPLLRFCLKKLMRGRADGRASLVDPETHSASDGLQRPPVIAEVGVFQPPDDSQISLVTHYGPRDEAQQQDDHCRR